MKKKLLTGLLAGIISISLMGGVNAWAAGVESRIPNAGPTSLTHAVESVWSPTLRHRARATRTQNGGVNMLVRANLFRNGSRTETATARGNNQVTARTALCMRAGHPSSGVATQ